MWRATAHARIDLVSAVQVPQPKVLNVVALCPRRRRRLQRALQDVGGSIAVQLPVGMQGLAARAPSVEAMRVRGGGLDDVHLLVFLDVSDGRVALEPLGGGRRQPDGCALEKPLELVLLHSVPVWLPCVGMLAIHFIVHFLHFLRCVSGHLVVEADDVQLGHGGAGCCDEQQAAGREDAGDALHGAGTGRHTDKAMGGKSGAVFALLGVQRVFWGREADEVYMRRSRGRTGGAGATARAARLRRLQDGSVLISSKAHCQCTHS